MREFYQIINAYPFTTFLLYIGIIGIILAARKK
jgi:hypothetical protein